MSAENDIGKLQEELQRTRDLLFQTAKLAEMGKLVAVVVHELSQPLLGIKAFAQMLRRQYQSDTFIEPKVRLIEEQAVHMEVILNSLRRHSKLPNVGRGSVDPLEPVRSAMELFRERAKKLRIQIQLQAPEKMPPVRGSHGLLQQVLVNLLSNALDELEGKPGGRIEIVLEPIQDAVRLRVVDNGRGVPEPARDLIFDMFYTSKDEEKGTGLGLFICKDILEQNQGSIRLMQRSEVEQAYGSGHGAGFEVLLARAPGDG